MSGGRGRGSVSLSLLALPPSPRRVPFSSARRRRHVGLREDDKRRLRERRRRRAGLALRGSCSAASSGLGLLRARASRGKEGQEAAPPPQALRGPAHRLLRGEEALRGG